MEEKQIVKISLVAALLPIVALIVMLGYNVFFVYGDNALGGSNQFVLLLGAAIAVLVGVAHKIPVHTMTHEIYNNIKSTSGAILILLLVGALSGTWLLSGIIPSMIYYGLNILTPAIFLPACVIICSLVSVAVGSSWTTSATIGIALVGIGSSLGIHEGLIGGAIISGGYFGDKMSPMSDTTNLAPALAGTDVFTHIRYMLFTTVPTISITLLIFIVIGLNIDTHGISDTTAIQTAILQRFNVTPWVFVVPAIILLMIYKKAEPLVALFCGVLLGVVFALLFQQDLLLMLTQKNTFEFNALYRVIMETITTSTQIPTDNQVLNELFSSSGMGGMLNTIWLIICAMAFGGVMEAIGALERITQFLLDLFTSVFGLFASTVISCLALNITTSDQYLALVVPGKMFAKAYARKGLAPENLSRTLEDSGTVTSVLIPWNTCAAYNSGVLGIPTLTYLPYAFFNLISPFMTLLFVAFNIKIRRITPQ
ncbi:Na+/H+ antiporter NhaC family protein [Capnocytophaga sp.]|uniref:Na+/H+ antiporter NhaC family protein n=1 Tax=Capnocytophaga sp. TaxID=44737 RepID=UPI0026DA9462|nr:Na+/H+ antiporter NhaC family protein [Capnocytophaga sp.]MDO5105791.1 Na+/H+ antiporter NhaC family protein [Capnocytophaga sp.]